MCASQDAIFGNHDTGAAPAFLENDPRERKTAGGGTDLDFHNGIDGTGFVIVLRRILRSCRLQEEEYGG